MRIINPDRDGLIEEHPFTKVLYAECRKELTSQIDNIRTSEGTNRREVVNSTLMKKLEALSRELSPLYEKELNELEDDENMDIGDYSKKFPLGLHVIPGGSHDILKGKKKTFTVIFVSNDNLDSQPVIVTSNNSKIKLNKNKITLDKNLSPVSGKGTFTVEGVEENQQATITCSYREHQKSINIRVVEIENLYQVPEGLFFDKNKQKYYIVYGKHKNINIYLKTNRYLENKVVWLSSSQPSDVVILGGSTVELSPTMQPHLFRGRVNLEGRRKKASAIITAKLEGFNAISANIIVEERDKSGIRFEFIPTEEDFGILRYKWDLVNKAKLFIGAKHPSIRRYLGESVNDQYPGIDSPLYYSVLAEVIASALAFEILKKKFIREGEEGKLDFETTNNFFHASFTKYLSVAHLSLNDNSKIKQFVKF